MGPVGRPITLAESSKKRREALAVRWACKKFYLYLYGIKFEIRNDHRPLVTVLGAQSNPPPARIERWLLSLQQLKYVLTHITGNKDNAADILSWLPVGQTQNEDTKETEDFAYRFFGDRSSGHDGKSYCDAQGPVEASIMLTHEGHQGIVRTTN